MLGTVRDQIGRAGVGVAIASGPERQVLIFDPGTSALLGEQSENRTTGSVDSWTVYLESSLVAAVPAGGTPLPSSPSRTQTIQDSEAGCPRRWFPPVDPAVRQAGARP